MNNEIIGILPDDTPITDESHIKSLTDTLGEKFELTIGSLRERLDIELDKDHEEINADLVELLACAITDEMNKIQALLRQATQ